MGIDIYARWKGMTKVDEKKQITGYSVEAGHVGYLRESYHGEPYATRYFVAEAFAAESQDAPIASVVLEERLVGAVYLTLLREAIVYHAGNPGDVVADGDQDGESIMKLVAGLIQEATSLKGKNYSSIVAKVPQALKAQIADRIRRRDLPAFALSYVDFAAFAAEKEAATGEPVIIRASY